MKEATLPLGPPLGPGVDISVLCIPLRARVGHLGSLQEPSSMRKNPYDTQRDSSCSCLRQGRSSRVVKGAQELASKARRAETSWAARSCCFPVFWAQRWWPQGLSPECLRPTDVFLT